MTVRDVGLQRAVEQLEDQYKLMIELLYLRGYSQREAAELTGIPLGTIKSRSLRAIQQLRQLLGGDLISLLLAWMLLTYLTYAYGY
jgi:RNA polymerase sigma-70 factor (ECF subfamily)